MKQLWENNRRVSNLAALLLLGLFAVCLLTVLLCGAKAYRQLTERDRQSYDSRTTLRYLAAKVQQAPLPEQVEVSDFAGSALCIGEEIDGTAYTTRLYCHGGWLMELFGAADEEFSPQDGEKIIEVKEINFTHEKGLILICLTQKNGQVQQMALSVRGGEEANDLDKSIVGAH